MSYLRDHQPGFIHNSTILLATAIGHIEYHLWIQNTIIALETDEKQHRYYDRKKEEIRYDDLYMIYSGKWIFIRFNPDSYSVNGIKKDPQLDSSLLVLLEEIEKQTIRIGNDENTELVEITYTFTAIETYNDISSDLREGHTLISSSCQSYRNEITTNRERTAYKIQLNWIQLNWIWIVVLIGKLDIVKILHYLLHL